MEAVTRLRLLKALEPSKMPSKLPEARTTLEQVLPQPQREPTPLQLGL